MRADAGVKPGVLNTACETDADGMEESGAYKKRDM